ncbi:MAG: tetraacyldisaccharide 4'-kinase [Oceanihabitans sp.]
MKFLRYILFPIMPVYYLVTWLRNSFYNSGAFASKSYSFPVICVGNLSVGGTGKTPMIEYLIRLLKDDIFVATLSRGYKRSTSGFYLADATATAKTLGDEPFQFYNKFKNEILVAVDANRQNGIEMLMQHKNAPDAILLDDAYQHRKVQAGFNILLTTYADLYINDWVLPTGNLREPRSGANRADCIVVTKCPENISNSNKSAIIKKLHAKKHQQIYFSSICYADKVVSENKKIALQDLKKFTLVTGIANPKPLVDYLKNNALDFEHLSYKDHYNFTDQDISQLSTKEVIVTTEKDYMRLLPYKALQAKVFYLPIAISIDNATAFNRQIKDFVGVK